MKTELFFMRTLFVLVAIASVTAMGGIVRSNVTPAHSVVQTTAASSNAG